MKEFLNWIVRKDHEIVGYLKGTRESVEAYIKKLQEDNSDYEYSAEGSTSEFNKNIKFKILNQ